METLTGHSQTKCWIFHLRDSAGGGLHHGERFSYRLRIEDESGSSVYQSGLLGDPVHIPNKVLPAGNYRWFVDARLK